MHHCMSIQEKQTVLRAPSGLHCQPCCVGANQWITCARVEIRHQIRTMTYVNRSNHSNLHHQVGQLCLYLVDWGHHSCWPLLMQLHMKLVTHSQWCQLCGHCPFSNWHEWAESILLVASGSGMGPLLGLGLVQRMLGPVCGVLPSIWALVHCCRVAALAWMPEAVVGPNCIVPRGGAMWAMGPSSVFVGWTCNHQWGELHPPWM